MNLMAITNPPQKIDTYTKKEKESKQNIKIIILSQKKRRRKEPKTTIKTTPKQLRNDNKYIPINNYFKCKWTKCFN